MAKPDFMNDESVLDRLQRRAIKTRSRLDWVTERFAVWQHGYDVAMSEYLDAQRELQSFYQAREREST